MASSRKTRVVLARRRSRVPNILSTATQAISSAAKRPIGLALLIFAVLLSVNYSADKSNNWITQLVASLNKSDTWKWLGNYINTHQAQTLHSVWIAAVCFLATSISTATLVSIVFVGLTLHMSAANTSTFVLQCVLTFFILAIRKPNIRALLVLVTALLVVFGSLFANYSFQ